MYIFINTSPIIVGKDECAPSIYDTIPKHLLRGVAHRFELWLHCVQSKISMLAQLPSFMMLHAFPLQNPFSSYTMTKLMLWVLSGDNNIIGLAWRKIYTSKQCLYYILGHSAHEKSTSCLIVLFFTCVFNHSTSVYKASKLSTSKLPSFTVFVWGSLKTPMQICLLFIKRY